MKDKLSKIKFVKSQNIYVVVLHKLNKSILLKTILPDHIF